jgi:hypothetical protein
MQHRDVRSGCQTQLKSAVEVPVVRIHLYIGPQQPSGACIACQLGQQLRNGLCLREARVLSVVWRHAVGWGT